MEGTHTGFLIKITGNRERHKEDGTWSTPVAEEVWEASVTHPSKTYIGIRQGALAQWVVLRPKVEVCTRDTGYEGGGAEGTHVGAKMIRRYRS